MDYENLKKFYEIYISLLIKKEGTKKSFKSQIDKLERTTISAKNKIKENYNKTYNKLFVSPISEYRKKLIDKSNKKYNKKGNLRIIPLFLKLSILAIIATVVLNFIAFINYEGGLPLGQIIGESFELFFIFEAFALFGAVSLAFLYKITFKFVKKELKRIELFFLEAKVERFKIKVLKYAEQAGFTINNLSEVGGFSKLLEDVEIENNELLVSIKSENQTLMNSIDNDLNYYSDYLPVVDAFNDYNHLMIMYNALITGRAENWKECLEVLSVELKHQEMINSINYIANLSSTLLNKSQTISAKVNNLQSQIRNSMENVNSRIENFHSSINTRTDAIVNTIYYGRSY